MEHNEYMRLAIDLANSTVGQTSPNPMVGAVIVKDGKVIGMGANLKAGEAHAEVQALKMAGEEAEGSTIYVTLEPCIHYGQTPPCVEALINAKVDRVIIADSYDPNPLVKGEGVKKLIKAGIDVIEGVEKEAAMKLNEKFKYYMDTKLPFVTLKTASTLDGKIATESGDSFWITSEESRLDAHKLRHENDAILVGVGTILKDNPKLTTRLPNGGKNPIRIVVDSKLTIPLDSKVITNKETKTWVITTDHASKDKKRALEDLDIRVISTGKQEHCELHRMLIILGENNVTSLLVEGGSYINGSFFKERLFNKVVSYIAPKFLGGSNSKSIFEGTSPKLMTCALDLHNVNVVSVGNDFKIVAYTNENSK